MAGLRRASLVAIHAALECYLSSFAEAPSPSRPEGFQPRGIMDNLLHVVVSPESDDSVVPFEDMKSMRIFQEECMVIGGPSSFFSYFFSTFFPCYPILMILLVKYAAAIRYVALKINAFVCPQFNI